MTELVFPVVGATVVFWVAVPLLSLVAWALLALARDRNPSIDGQASSWRYALTIAPTLAPVIWLVSASIHQAERGAPVAACVIDHLGGELCRDVVLFGSVLFAILGVGVASRIGGERAPRRRTPVSTSSPAAARLRRICSGHHALAPFAGRVRVVERGLAPICTRGLLRPTVEIEAGIADQLGDRELQAALLHELDHARAGDPLRLLVAQVALTLNPLGRLLEAELGRFWFAREVTCDRRAVQLGADPLSLARSIVAVAGEGSAPAPAVGLGSHDVAGIRVRVHLLLGYATRRPAPAPARARVDLPALATALMATLPHVTGTGPLDLLHRGVESAALLIGIG